jgi:hypothetical protein
MNLKRYLAVQYQMRPGDVIAFSGHALISYLIDAFSGSNLSHIAIVRNVSGTSTNADVVITESTIHNGKSGPQSRTLGGLLEEYGEDCQAWWLPLSDEVRRDFNLFEFYKFIGSAEGSVRYDIPGLFGFLARSVPILGPRICQGESAKRMFCSGYAVDCLEHAGALRGINYSKTSPQDLAEMHIYREYVQILGECGKIARFNSV